MYVCTGLEQLESAKWGKGGRGRGEDIGQLFENCGGDVINCCTWQENSYISNGCVALSWAFGTWRVPWHAPAPTARTGSTHVSGGSKFRSGQPACTEGRWLGRPEEVSARKLLREATSGQCFAAISKLKRCHKLVTMQNVHFVFRALPGPPSPSLSLRSLPHFASLALPFPVAPSSLPLPHKGSYWERQI